MHRPVTAAIVDPATARRGDDVWPALEWTLPSTSAPNHPASDKRMDVTCILEGAEVRWAKQRLQGLERDAIQRGSRSAASNTIWCPSTSARASSSTPPSSPSGPTTACQPSSTTLLGAWLDGLRELVEHVGGLVHPTALLARRPVDLAQGFPEAEAMGFSTRSPCRPGGQAHKPCLVRGGIHAKRSRERARMWPNELRLQADAPAPGY